MPPEQMQEFLQKYPLLTTLIPAIQRAGGQVLLVGGAVRDLILGLPIKDIDIEVHGISLDTLESALSTFGPVSSIGKAYGVLRLHRFDADWAVPRSDAAGRKPLVTIDPYLNFNEAFRRRDLTMNAMGIDIATGTLIDPFGGLDDLRDQILRTPDVQRFVEDPLRFYRVMQFIARFGMAPDATLNNVCSSMDISNVSRERKEQEFSKLLLKAQRPSLGIRWLKQIGRLHEVLPELAATVGIQQDPTWHPEGDVFEHTMQVLDVAAALSYDSEQEKLIGMYAALCHDLGKAVSTENNNGTITSYGHEITGVPLTRSLLKHITASTALIECVEKLVRYHMLPLEFVAQGSKANAYKRLAHALAPTVTMKMLADLAYADRAGRSVNPEQPITLTPNPAVETFKTICKQHNILYHAEKPILSGKDIKEYVREDKEIGALLRKAYELQLQEGITDKEVLKKRILNND